ncbi:streptococcal hemagglutinin-like isoform X2 [Stegostoma tigrinum]|uniref:streptococcal hemagglutinin-like isoform X2 n=1 Tax=Stegostoma tigrinum TaxID=3053191 RepID=UPI00286FD9BD|nr:streptococcal hemagglutinin-like isoform X2 [Stegostoma tigrinum]
MSTSCQRRKEIANAELAEYARGREVQGEGGKELVYFLKAAMEASLTCAVCLSIFENPTTLPVCSHNFCKKCILECVTKSFSYGLDYSSSNNNNIWKNSQLECPLCRKSNFIAEGAVNLPGNTTLAEVVKLFRSQQQAVGAGREQEDEELPLVVGSGTRSLGERELCQRHPHRKLQLFCKVCKQLACGQCVSEDHRGVFHAVNLVDMIYQEEKYILDYEKEVIKSKIDRILEKVELKRRQLVDEIEKNKEWKERERKAQLEGKRTQKKTIEQYLKECEKLVNECNPVNFLMVACDLNERVKSNLAIILPTLEKRDELTCLQPHQFLIKPVLDSISALQLTKDATNPSLGTNNTTSELRTDGYQFRTTLKMWKQSKDFIEPKFTPETIIEYGCHDYLWCISAKEDYQDISLEELRYKHYQSCRKDWNCFVTEGYSDSENGLEPSVSSVSTELCKTPDGVQKPHVKLFSFGQSFKKVKKKFRGNVYVPLPSNSRSATSIRSVSNSELLLPSEKLFDVGDIKQKHDPVPPSSVQSETISNITSTVDSLPTAAVAASLAVTLSSCTTVTSSDKTDERQQKPFTSHALGFTASKCFSSPSEQKKSSISKAGVRFLNRTVTSGSSPSFSGFMFGNTLANKSEDQQTLPISTGFSFEKLNSCSATSNSTSSSTSVFHSKTTCESTGKQMKHQNGQTSSNASSTCISKVLTDSVGTSSSFHFGKGKEQCSQENSPKPNSFGTSGPLNDQVKPVTTFSFFNSGTETSGFSFKTCPSITSTTKSSEFLRNPESLACLTGSSVGRDVTSPFKFSQVPRSDVPTFYQKQPLSTTSRSTTPSFDFKLANSSIVTPASSLFTSPSSSSSIPNPALNEQSLVTSQSGVGPLKHVASSAEKSSVFSRTNSIVSDSVVFLPVFDQEPISTITKQQTTATLDSITIVKKLSTSGLSINAEPLALRNCKGLTPITPPVIASDVPDLFALTQVSVNDVPNLNEKPFLSTVSRSKSPSFDFKLENPGTVVSASSLLASTSIVSNSSNSSSLSIPVAQNMLPTQNSIKPLQLFASCAEMSSVCSRANSIGSNAVTFTTNFNLGCTPTVSQQQSTVRAADVKMNEIQTSEASIYAESSTLNGAHSFSLNCEDPSLVVNQQSSDKVSTDNSVETHKLKETLLAETLTSQPEIFHRIESASSGCVDFATGFNRVLPSISQQQNQVAFIDDSAIKTCKTKTFEVPECMQQSVIGKIAVPLSQLSNATPNFENPLERCNSDIDEEGKKPVIFSDQGCNVSENQGHSNNHQSSAVASEIEHPDSLTAKESPSLIRKGWTNIETLNLSHTGDSACIPQPVASNAGSFAEANNDNAQEDNQRTARDLSLFTVDSLVFCPIFKFGAGSDFQFTLGASKLTSSTGQQEKNEGDCKTAHKPIFPFPPPVNHPAAIPDAENVLFSNRGKLYCFERTSLQWKERAFGEIRVLEHKITKLSRFVMWNATNKCCANHWITRDLELKHAKTSNHIWTWHALDYSENKQVLLEFAVHFKLKERAEMFRQVIERVQSSTEIARVTEKHLCSSAEIKRNDQNRNDGPASLVSVSELEKGGKFLRGIEEQAEDGDDDVVMLSEVTPTSEQRALALELFLPPTFFCYKNRPGYQSSDDEEDSFETAVKKLYPNYNTLV